MRFPIGLALLAAVPSAQEPARVEIGKIRVTTRNVYSWAEIQEDDFYDLFNILHVPTDPEVVRRELWFGEGGAVTREEIEELERNLRALGLFGEVQAELVERGEGNPADLEIATRDRFSLVLQAAVARVGGTQTYATALGDLNVLGTGKQIIARANRNDLDERSSSLSYRDPQFLGTWYDLAAAIGETEEGTFFSLGVERPFQHLADPFSYGASIAKVDASIDYFERGASAAEVPIHDRGGRIFVARSFGPRDRRGSLGLQLAADDRDYDPATGRDAGITRVPGDTKRVEAGPFWRIDWVDSYREVAGLDAIDYVEDLTLGTSLHGGISGLLRDEAGREGEVQPLARAGGRAALELFEDNYLTAEVDGWLRWNGDGTQGWDVDAALHAYNTSLPRQTLAASVRFRGVFDAQDLVPQLTLGEDNGLRGYPAREFAGSRTVVLNLEDRLDTGVELWSVHVGLAAFVDVGWVHGRAQNLSQSDAIRAAGVGLRFGASELFGGGVARMDFAVPLDDVNGQDYGLSVSFSVGQVFTFFGNQSALRTEF